MNGPQVGGVILPARSDLPAAPRGVVLHWTGGGPTANSTDLMAYHYVVDHDGKLRPGHWPVSANMRTASGSNYAHHTGGRNSFVVGIAGAGMADYESPRQPGKYPLTLPQVQVMCTVAAYFGVMTGGDLLDPKVLCTHQEVWTLLGIAGQHNKTKKDIEFLSFQPSLSPEEVGTYLREMARYLAIQKGWLIEAETPNLSAGERGRSVERLQRILGVRVNGIFDPPTENAVRLFQHQHLLKVDGVVGPKTWKLLLEHEHPT